MNLQSLMHTRKPPFIMLSTPSITDRTVTISTIKYAQCFSFRTSSNPLSALFKRPKNPSFKAVKCSLKEDRVLESKDAALLVSTCIRRILSPALTLEQGLDKIQEAVEELKGNPHCSSRGMITFEVAVPPSAKALNWFFGQHDKAGVFPLFFLSKNENPSYKTLALGKTRGVFGIGAAIYFKGYYSHTSMSYTELKRYSSTESAFPLVYGFLDVNYDTVSSTLKHQAGSFYFFIPQIELHEFEEVTLLVATLAWNNSSICSFEEAIEAYEFSLYKVP